jgi:ribonuclease VapC
MAVVDTSVLVAILLHEPEAEALANQLLGFETLLIAEPNWVESNLVMAARKGEEGIRALHRLADAIALRRVPADARVGDAAVRAWQRFGEGRHPGISLHPAGA